MTARAAVRRYERVNLRRLVLASVLLGASPAVLEAQAPSGSDQATFDPDHPPADMPPPPDSAPPAEAPAETQTDGRPPHPATPAPLDEPQPTAQELAQSPYHWLPGHWVWTGQRFEWSSGRWIYKVDGYVLVPPRWAFVNGQWAFVAAG